MIQIMTFPSNKCLTRIPPNEPRQQWIDFSISSGNGSGHRTSRNHHIKEEEINSLKSGSRNIQPCSRIILLKDFKSSMERICPCPLIIISILCNRFSVHRTALRHNSISSKSLSLMLGLPY